jgi:predicted nucleic acid-binding protein
MLEPAAIGDIRSDADDVTASCISCSRLVQASTRRCGLRDDPDSYASRSLICSAVAAAWCCRFLERSGRTGCGGLFDTADQLRHATFDANGARLVSKNVTSDFDHD